MEKTTVKLLSAICIVLLDWSMILITFLEKVNLVIALFLDEKNKNWE
jgi:cytochrome c oxidase subunit IV